MTRLLTLALLLGLSATPVLAASERGQTSCLNRCQSYKVFCNSEVLRQIEELAKNGDTCLAPGQEQFSLDQCNTATKQCENSCFISKPAAATRR